MACSAPLCSWDKPFLMGMDLARKLGLGVGGLQQAVCVCTYVCVYKWPCHAVPSRAETCWDRAEQGQFLLALGKSRTSPAVVSPSWGALHSPAQAQGTRVLRGPCSCPLQTLLWSTTALIRCSAEGQETCLSPGRWRGPLLHAVLNGGLWPSRCRWGRAADGMAGWLHPSS